MAEAPVLSGNSHGASPNDTHDGALHIRLREFNGQVCGNLVSLPTIAGRELFEYAATMFSHCLVDLYFHGCSLRGNNDTLQCLGVRDGTDLTVVLTSLVGIVQDCIDAFAGDPRFGVVGKLLHALRSCIADAKCPVGDPSWSLSMAVCPDSALLRELIVHEVRTKVYPNISISNVGLEIDFEGREGFHIGLGDAYGYSVWTYGSVRNCVRLLCSMLGTMDTSFFFTAPGGSGVHMHRTYTCVYTSMFYFGLLQLLGYSRLHIRLLLAPGGRVVAFLYWRQCVAMLITLCVLQVLLSYVWYIVWVGRVLTSYG